MDNLKDKKRVAKNTALLYFRMIITMFVSLYTSRVILNVLGVEDYGIYSVVAGIVTMATLFTGSLASASQRFITFELGKSDSLRLKQVFISSLLIHVLIAAVIFLLSETIGYWFLNEKMNIPPHRLHAANWVLHCSVLVFSINILNVPFLSLIIAHERMNAFAYISILEVTVKLFVVYLLTISPFDKLISYAVLSVLIAVVIQSIYNIYCRINFSESKAKPSLIKKSLLKEMMTFAGFNFIEISANMINKQGANFLLNIYFGPTLNAARGISMQINNVVDSFVTNFTTAINPQIMKSYAANNKDYVFELMEKGARYSFYLFLIIAIPMIVQTEAILTFWLKIVPEYAVIFVRLIFLDSLIELMTRTFYTVISASGKIKHYQLTIGCFKLLNFPLCYLSFSLFNSSPEVIYIISIVFTIIVMLLKLFLIKRIITFSVSHYIKTVIFKCLIVAVLGIFIPFFLFGGDGASEFWWFVLKVTFSFLFGVLIIFLLGIDGSERRFLKEVFSRSVLSKLRK